MMLFFYLLFVVYWTLNFFIGMPNELNSIAMGLNIVLVIITLMYPPRNLTQRKEIDV